MLPLNKAEQHKFAPVASREALWNLERMEVLGDYHLLLAHLVLQQPYAWKQLFSFLREKRQNQGGKLHVILDNSMVELGASLPPADCLAAARAVLADVVVLPDYYEDTELTIKAVEDSSQHFRGEGFELMGVVQGRTTSEVINCGNALCDLGVDWIGVPRHLQNKGLDRLGFARLFNNRGIKVHLLGFSDYPLIDCRAASHSYVEGVDSSVPIYIGQEGRILYQSLGPTLYKRPDDYFTHSTYRQVNEEVIENLRRVRSWVSTTSNG